MSSARDLSSARSSRSRRALGALLALVLGACGTPEAEPEAAAIEREADGAAAPPIELPEPPARVEDPPPPPPPPPPAPVPDPEAAARARAEAARLAFEREYPWHGVAYHFLAQVHERPDAASPVIGYLRRGARFRAQPTLRGPGCERGWSRIPGDGFVCRGVGFQLGDGPQSFEPSPVAPALDVALPYAYAWVVRDDVPQYWRIPTREEEAVARAWIGARRAAERASTTPDEDAPEPDLEAPPGLDELPPPEEEVAVDAGVPAAPATPDEPPSFLRMRMQRGFYVSIDRLETATDGRRFYRTIRGAYVPADAVAEASPPAMRGVVLGGRWSLPIGFVFRGGVRGLARDPARDVLRAADPIERLTPLPIQSEVVTRGPQRYRVSDRGQIVREDALRIASLRARPATVPEGARWIHVDLAQQVLVAYEGDRPVFATLVSTGREGYATPTGTFRIQSKHVSTTMDDPDAGAEAYSIEDVPWTMYFEGSYALHGAFWHDRFGRVRSHGCVNLAPADARWVFHWSEPTLPPSWHGASARRAAPGAYVHVTAE